PSSPSCLRRSLRACWLKKASSRGHRLAHWLVPRELAFFNQHARSDRRKQLGVRCNGTHRARREWKLLLVIAISITLRENEFVAGDNADTDGWPVPILEDLGHVFIEAFETLGDIQVLCRSERRAGENES